jgi:putative ATP-binding cassette transporter
MNGMARFLAFLIGRSRWRFWLALAAGLVSGIGTSAQVALINAAVDGRHTTRRLELALSFAALLLLAPAARLLAQYLLLCMGQDGVYQLRLDLARRILATPLRRLEQSGPHRLIAVFTEDIAAIIESVLAIPDLITNTALIVAVLAYIGWLSPFLLLVFLGIFVPVLFAYRYPLALGFAALAQVREEQDVLYRHLRGITEGAKELKLHRDRREGFLGVFAGTAAVLRRLQVRASLIMTSAISGAWTFFFVAAGLVIFVVPAWRPVRGDVLVGVAVGLLFIRGPLQLLVSWFPVLARGGVAIEKIQRLGLWLGQEGLEAEAPLGQATAPWHRLDLVGATYSFHREGGDDTFTLGPIDLTVRPGELIFVVGGNGSGKTSLAKLLLGLYEPESGEIRLDGERIGRDGMDRYRQSFGAVFFDFFLFDELLGLGGKSADREAHTLLKLLRLDRKLEVREGRLSTLDLSQGQRKRLALLTALLEKRPLYLFDEWTADQDPEFKEVFYREILPGLCAQGKTVLAISHDDRYHALAGRILQLSEGRIVFDGTPAAFAAELSTRIAPSAEILTGLETYR